MNKRTIALLSALFFMANTHGMWFLLSMKSTKVAVSKSWSTIKENKGFIGATAVTASVVYGTYKAYQYYTAPEAMIISPDLLEMVYYILQLNDRAAISDEEKQSWENVLKVRPTACKSFTFKRLAWMSAERRNFFFYRFPHAIYSLNER